MVAEDDWLESLHAYSRCSRIVREMDERLPLGADADEEPATKGLLDAYSKAAHKMANGGDRIGSLHQVMTDLRDPINRFFDDVMVMAEDAELRKARLSLMQHIAGLADGVVDLSRMDGF